MKKKINVFYEINKPKTPKNLYFFIGIFAFWFFFLSIFSQGMESRCTGFFFLSFDDFLADFLNVVGYSAYGDPYHCLAYTGLSEKGYPPLCYVLMRPFANLVPINQYYEQNNFLDMYHKPLLLLMIMLMLSFIMITLYSIIKSKTDGNAFEKNLMAALLVMSSPVLFTIERGNIILLSFVFVMIFIFYYNDENAIKKELALVSLGLAFGLKLSPALFGCLLLFNKQYKEAVRAAIYGLLFLFVPFLFLKGGFSNIPDMIGNMRLLSASYSADSGCTLTSCLTSIGSNPDFAFLIGGRFRYLVCLYLGVCSIFCRRYWERVTILGLIILLIPIPSHYYNILYMIPSAILFFKEKQFRKLDWIALICFIILFSLNVERYIPHIFNYRSALFCLMLLMIFYGTVPMLIWLTRTVSLIKRKK